MTGFCIDHVHFLLKNYKQLMCFRIRGRLGSVFILSTGAGILFAYTCGTFFNYTTLPFIYMPLTVLYLIGAMFHPESAHYLVKKKLNRVKLDLNLRNIIKVQMFSIVAWVLLFIKFK